jgi:hypothetical protein
VVLSILLVLGCGGGGDGPSGPANPTVSGINPSQARPGDQVTISGSNFGTNVATVSVTFNGVAAQVVSVANTSIVAVVPNISQGSVSVSVTVSGRTSSSTSFSVLRAPPAITSVSPSSVRAGDILIIRGQNFTALRTLQLSGNTPQVLIDGVTLGATSVTATELQVAVPLDLTPGNHTLRIQLDSDVSNTLNFTSEIFTATGTYGAEGPVTLNSCGFSDFPIGSRHTFEVSMTDNRPTLNARIGGITGFFGTLTPGGSFNVSQTEGTVTSSFSGNLLGAPGGVVGFSALIEVRSNPLACSVIFDVIGARLSTVPTSRRVLDRTLHGDARQDLSGSLKGLTIR